MRRTKGGKEKNTMVALFVFIIATYLAIVFGQKKLLGAKGPFCNNAIKNSGQKILRPEMTSATLKWHTLKDWQNSLETF